MNKFIFLIWIIIITLNCSSPLSIEKSNLICSEKDREYAEFWDNYYDPAEAYEFGEKIKKSWGHLGASWGSWGPQGFSSPFHP